MRPWLRGSTISMLQIRHAGWHTYAVPGEIHVTGEAMVGPVQLVERPAYGEHELQTNLLKDPRLAPGPHIYEPNVFPLVPSEPKADVLRNRIASL